MQNVDIVQMLIKCSSGAFGPPCRRTAGDQLILGLRVVLRFILPTLGSDFYPLSKAKFICRLNDIAR